MARSFSAWFIRPSLFAAILVLSASITGCGSHPRTEPEVVAGTSTPPSESSAAAASPSPPSSAEHLIPITSASVAPESREDPGVAVKEISDTSQTSTAKSTPQEVAVPVVTSAVEATTSASSTPVPDRAVATPLQPVSVTSSTPSTPTPTTPITQPPAPQTAEKASPLEVDSVPSPLERLAGLMCGEFSSADQAAFDPDYRDISLKISRIWPTSSDGIWLYVEQAVAAMADRPYRQRIYHLTSVPHAKVPTFRSDVYTLPGDPRRFVGAWQNPTKLADITPASLTIREGCAVILTQTSPVSFAGSTVDRNCQSEFQKASYATSEVTITPQSMISWDRGFDNDGKQVWGATNGGYKFLRITPPSKPLTVPEK